MEERYKMYLEKARNVSDLSYRTPAAVTQVLSRPVPPDCTALLVSLSSHFPPTLCLACQAPGGFQVSPPILSSHSSASGKMNAWLTETVKHGQQ